MVTNIPSASCIHFSALPLGLRTLYTSAIIVLSTGYLFAMIHVFESHAGRDGNPMLSVDDLVIAYSGSNSDTRLEAALKGPMSSMLPTNEKDELIAWVRSGAEEKDFAGVEATQLLHQILTEEPPSPRQRGSHLCRDRSGWHHARR